MKQTCKCNTGHSCPEPCVWGEYGEWSKCDLTCYVPEFDEKGEPIGSNIHRGIRKRSRIVARKAINGGTECDPMQAEQVQSCPNPVTKMCPVDCVWGEWEAWADHCEACREPHETDEEKFLEKNIKTRVRKVETQSAGEGICNDHKGDPVINELFPDRETVPCHDGPIEAIPVCAQRFARWGQWGEFGDCDEPCGSGGRMRSERECQIYEEINGVHQVVTDDGGDECKKFIKSEADKGFDTTEKFLSCPKDMCLPSLGPWSGWTECSKTCGKGEKTRTRKCLGVGKEEVDADIIELSCGKAEETVTESCDNGACGYGF